MITVKSHFTGGYHPCIGLRHPSLSSWSCFFCPRSCYSAWCNFCIRWLVLRFCLTLPQPVFDLAYFCLADTKASHISSLYIYRFCCFNLPPFVIRASEITFMFIQRTTYFWIWNQPSSFMQFTLAVYNTVVPFPMIHDFWCGKYITLYCPVYEHCF